MPEEIDRPKTGVRGVFPFRFPVGKFLALVSFLLLIPVWWTVGEMATPRIKTYYAKTYWQTLTDGWTLAPGGLPKRGVYRVLAVGPVSSPLLATQVTLDSVKDIREQWVELESKAFHKWLSDNIYQGAELSIYYLFAGCVVVSGLVLFWSGAEWDWRRFKALIGVVPGSCRGVDSTGGNLGRCGCSGAATSGFEDCHSQHCLKRRGGVAGWARPASVIWRQRNGNGRSWRLLWGIGLLPCWRPGCVPFAGWAGAGQARKDRGFLSGSGASRVLLSRRSCWPTISTFSVEPGVASPR